MSWFMLGHGMGKLIRKLIEWIKKERELYKT